MSISQLSGDDKVAAARAANLAELHLNNAHEIVKRVLPLLSGAEAQKAAAVVSQTIATNFAAIATLSAR